MAIDRPLTERIRPGGEGAAIAAYEKAGGYEALRKALAGMTPQEVTKLVTESNLRGRGGAGFPTGPKWSFVPMGSDAPRPKYLVANADEMEPGTFKDRLLMEEDPHQLIEGMLLAAYAIKADVAYIFLRWEYRLAERRLRRAIAEAFEAGYLGRNILGSGWDLDMFVHISAGRSMCGEETGLLPGGASTDFLVEEHLDVKMDFASIARAGSRLGTGTMIVLDDRTCPVGMVQNLEEFFAQESCGWCTPCREGLPWTARLLEAIEEGQGRPEDLEQLSVHCKLLGPGNTFCAL